MHKFQVSVVMAVYETAPHLREAVDSITAQDIGFDKIQLILVDAGTTDGSGTICDEYAARYPRNIVVIHAERSDVSAARNEGMKQIQGKYVNFMDPQDTLSANTMGDMVKFFDDHYEEVQIAACPVKFFGEKTGSSDLNDKFKKGSRIINLNQEWGFTQLFLGSAFFRADALDGCRFGEGVDYVAEICTLQRLLLDRCALGVVKSAQYNYRWQNTRQNAVFQPAADDARWYLPAMEQYLQDVVGYAVAHYGYVPNFIQYGLMYDLQIRLQQHDFPLGVLEEGQKQAYLDAVGRLLQHISDPVIMDIQKFHREFKFRACMLKYPGGPVKARHGNDLVLRFPGGAAFPMSACPSRMDFIYGEADGVALEGTVPVLAHSWERMEIYARANGRQYPCTLTASTIKKVSLGTDVQIDYIFKARIPLEKDRENRIDIVLELDGIRIPLAKASYTAFFPVTGKYHSAYANCGGWVVQAAEDGISVTAAANVDLRKMEKAFCREVWKKAYVGGRNAVLGRIAARVLAKFKRRPLWLISDRANRAGDNGEAFFRYMRKNHPEIGCYYVIDKNCPDYKMMKKVGPVIHRLSFRHKLMLMISDCILSSHAQVEIYNPFRHYSDAYQDILTSRKFVFLQHGVTKDDQSAWLRKRNRNLSGFVVAAEPEYQSIVDGAYDYTEKEVWRTGFPRFDRLYDADEKMITLMPTWRKYLMGTLDNATGQWRCVAGFEDSKFFRFYNQLINDPRLLETLSRHGYTLNFFLHPNFQGYIDKFTKNPHVVFADVNTEYRDLYAKSSLILTDFSSAVFDFAYLRKPLLYAHFDAEEFFAGGHSYSKGYFEYERDGFGEVEYTVEDTVDRIIEYVENGCRLKDQYRKRIDDFFLYNDQNNSQRVYEWTMRMNHE